MKKFSLLALLGLSLCCAKLPSDFESLSLKQKVAAYEEFFADGGISSVRAVNGIASHGVEGANAMIPYLHREDGAIPRHEALEIVWNVQTTQESLRGSAVERALRTIQQSDPRQDDADFLKTTLEAIEEDFWTSRPAKQE